MQNVEYKTFQHPLLEYNKAFILPNFVKLKIN